MKNLSWQDSDSHLTKQKPSTYEKSQLERFWFTAHKTRAIYIREISAGKIQIHTLQNKNHLHMRNLSWQDSDSPNSTIAHFPNAITSSFGQGFHLMPAATEIWKIEYCNRFWRDHFDIHCFYDEFTYIYSLQVYLDDQ